LEFHHFVSWSMSSTTFASSSKIHLGDWIGKDIGVISHLSPHTHISLPSPTLHRISFFCFDDTCCQGIGILQKPPTLFGQETGELY
jgi:hypothetical protein